MLDSNVNGKYIHWFQTKWTQNETQPSFRGKKANSRKNAMNEKSIKEAKNGTRFDSTNPVGLFKIRFSLFLEQNGRRLFLLFFSIGKRPFDIHKESQSRIRKLSFNSMQRMKKKINKKFEMRAKGNANWQPYFFRQKEYILTRNVFNEKS